MIIIRGSSRESRNVRPGGERSGRWGAAHDSRDIYACGPTLMDCYIKVDSEGGMIDCW